MWLCTNGQRFYLDQKGDTPRPTERNAICKFNFSQKCSADIILHKCIYLADAFIQSDLKWQMGIEAMKAKSKINNFSVTYM